MGDSGTSQARKSTLKWSILLPKKNFYKQVELGTIETPLPQNASKFEVITTVEVILVTGVAGLYLLDRIIEISSKQGTNCFIF